MVSAPRTIKRIVQKVMDEIQKRWSPRHALFVMSEVHTSRSEFDDLRHLLSYVYNRDKDTFELIKAWVNPWDDSDAVDFATLASRKPRERELPLEKCAVHLGAVMV